MLFIVRHGERADLKKNNKDIELIYDSHLTQNGISQSIQTGIFLNKLISEYESKLIYEKKLKKPLQVLLFCSPFLRTIQSAYYFAQNIAKIHKNTIFLQESIGEMLSKHKTKGFTENTMSELHIRKYPEKIYKQNKYIDLEKFQINIENSYFFQNNDFQKVKYPETQEDCKKRVFGFLELFSKEFFENFDPCEFVVIIVTHAYIVDYAYEYYNMENIYG